MSNSIYLIRHTPVGVEPGLCYGRTDVPLANDAETALAASSAGIQTLLAEANTTLEAALVVSSPSERCMRLATALHRTPQTDDGLLEFEFGRWEASRTTCRTSWTGGLRTSLTRVHPAEKTSLKYRRARWRRYGRACMMPTGIWLCYAWGVIAHWWRACWTGPRRCVRLHTEFGRVSCIRLSTRGAELRYLNR